MFALQIDAMLALLPLFALPMVEHMDWESFSSELSNSIAICSTFWGKGRRAILRPRIALLEHQPQDINEEPESRISAEAMPL